ncbi:MAG TPA: hypothetical protein PL151_19375 [Phycisphaerae bacterium]|nr:hypothetical protein [Phycisphaerae bacterium]HOJ75159.1 hypothetical protein [Phycisphaerae bacterium]HOM52490.1 hypothetical protein [Phycisphaerae bacterium]HON69216.1 hypothetical protein [Phycisphaerae bacterium]HOQ88223.1 hypothetical protein [Phycisphaerae bacterium]
MRATYRRKVAKSSIGAEPEIIGREDALRGRVAVELPVSLAEVVQRVSEEIGICFTRQ